MSNCKKKDMQSTENKIKNMKIEVINNVTRVVNKPDLNQAIGNTGATGNFVQPGAPVDDIKVTGTQLKLKCQMVTLNKARMRATYGSRDCLKN